MQLEHFSHIILTKKLRLIFQKHLPSGKYRVFYFGSRVTGQNSEKSDIDIGVLGPLPIEDRKMRLIREEIENLPLLYKIDIVDFHLVSLRFRNRALSNIEQIYG